MPETTGRAPEAAQTPPSPPAELPSLAEATREWGRIGLLSFGGPAAQIALMHRVVVEERAWLSERQFLNALSFCMLLPGPEAMQLATYAGWRLHGLKGGLTAGLLFVMPGAAVMLALAAVYAAFGTVPLINALFFGIKAAVLVIVVEALVRVARRTLHRTEHWAVAAVAFIAIFFLDLSFPLIVLGAALFGFWRGGGAASEVSQVQARRPGTLRRTLATIAVWLAIWWLPVLFIAAFSGAPVLAEIGLFFSKLAVVTFGGAYAVLAYMAQDVVNSYGWLTPGEMLDGLGLAETTPGPLILVTEFVGFLAAWREGGWALGLAGAALTLHVTFAPCFLWIFAGAPYVEWIASRSRLRGALTAITAAVVGVILNLSIWFALHVLFAQVTAVRHGPVLVWTPDPASLDWRVPGLAAVSAVLVFAFRWNVAGTLAVAAILGVGVSHLG